MIKRALAATLCLMLVFALLPKTARAITPDYTLYYNIEDSSLHKGSINGDVFTENSNWSGDGCNLTLFNFQFTTSARIALKMPPSACILINGGTSMLKSTYGSGDNYGIYSLGDMQIATVSGYGALTATCGSTTGDSYGVYVNSFSFVINDSVDLTATGGAAGGSSYGVYAVDGLRVGNFGSLTATGGTATNGVSAGVLVTDGGIFVGNGRLTATGGAADDNSYGVFATGDITTLADDASIMGTGSQATTLSSYGVYSENGDITARDGSITGTGGASIINTSFGVFAGCGKVAVEGGSITGIGVQGGSNNSRGVYTNQLDVSSGLVVCESAEGGKGLVKAVFTPPQSTYYWRLSKTGPYKASTSTPLPVDLSAETYVEIRTKIPVLGITVSVPAFAPGQAPQDETVTVESDEGINATDNFDSATMDGAPINLGSVGTPGADGNVSNGSIVIHLNKTYLDKLSAGTHILVVNLAGVYAGQTVRTTITVLPSGGGIGGAGADVPQTGDSATPILWLSLILLTGAGLAVRRNRRNG